MTQSDNVFQFPADQALRDALQAAAGGSPDLTMAIEDLRGVLKESPESDTSRGMDIVDAKISAAEARTDTKFAQILGELSTMRAEINGRLDTMVARVEHVEKSTSGIKTTVIVTAIAALGLTVAIMSYGSQWFGLGMDSQQVSDRAAQSAIEQFQPRLDALDGKLDQLLQVTRPRPSAQP